MLGSAERGKVRLISRDVIFQELIPTMTEDDTSTSQTDRRPELVEATVLCLASRSKKLLTNSLLFLKLDQ